MLSEELPPLLLFSDQVSLFTLFISLWVSHQCLGKVSLEGVTIQREREREKRRSREPQGTASWPLWGPGVRQPEGGVDKKCLKSVAGRPPSSVVIIMGSGPRARGAVLGCLVRLSRLPVRPS